MKLALLAPAGAMHRYTGSFGKALHYAPLTLTTLAALTPVELCSDIVIYDETAEPIPKEIDADLIVITAITGTANRAYCWADYFRAKGHTVVMGGVHPTIMSQEAKAHVDSVMVGFAEYTWPQMLQDYCKGQLKPFYTQQEAFSLEGHPAPRRDLLKASRYVTLNTVEAIRGCPLPCTFCAYPAAFGRQVYTKPVADVVREIEQMPGKSVLFPDVNLIAHRPYAKELFKEMIPLKRQWFGLATSDIADDPELFDIIVKSGCKGLLIGFESVTQNSQKFVGKGINRVSSYDHLVKKLHHAGIAINGCFAFGGDEEDTGVFERTVEEIVRLKIDLPRFSILTPFPGTELYQSFDQQNRIFERDWAMYDVEHCVFWPKQMSPEQLEEGITWAWNETYKALNIAKRLATPGMAHGLAAVVNFAYKGYAKKFKAFTKEVMTDNSDIG